MNKIQLSDITIAIIAGGKGARLNKQDKGLVSLKGKPIIEHILQKINTENHPVIINANRNISAYKKYNYPVIQDTLRGHQGPLAGIQSIMRQATTSHIITLPCDAPSFPPDYIARMRQTVNLLDSQLTVAHDGRRLQPLHALLPLTLLDDLSHFLQGDNRKTSAWYTRHDFHVTDFADQADTFFNINTPQQLHSWTT